MGKRSTKKKETSKTEKVIIIVLLCLLLICGIVIAFTFNSRKQKEVDDIPLNLVGTYDTEDRLYFQKNNRKVVLINGINGNDIQYLFLVVVDEEKQTMQPIHFSRNTLCEYNELDEFGKIVGKKTGLIRDSFKGPSDSLVGLVNVKDVVNKLFCNIRIDYYMSVDMTAIEDITSIFNGIDVRLYDDYTDINPNYVKDSEVTIWPKDAVAFVIGDEDKEGAERIEGRINRYVSGFFELNRKKYEYDEGFFARKFAEMTKYCLFNSNDLITYAEQTIEYKHLPLIDIKGSQTDEGYVLDVEDIEKVCLESIYK